MMSDSTVVTPHTVIPETVTVDGDLVIETVACICAVSSLLSSIGYGEIAEWLDGPAEKLERTAFDCVGIMREDDDPLVVAVVSRSEELAAEIMDLCGGDLREIAERYRLSAQKIRENGTTDV